MRYEAIDSIIFTDINGIATTIKDMREYPDYQTFVKINLKNGDEIDEIASRQDIYGNEGEGESFKIVDNNIIKLFEADFNLEELNKLDIPL